MEKKVLPPTANHLKLRKWQWNPQFCSILWSKWPFHLPALLIHRLTHPFLIITKLRGARSQKEHYSMSLVQRPFSGGILSNLLSFSSITMGNYLKCVKLFDWQNPDEFDRKIFTQRSVYTKRKMSKKIMVSVNVPLWWIAFQKSKKFSLSVLSFVVSVVLNSRVKGQGKNLFSMIRA